MRYLIATQGPLNEPVTDQIAECLQAGKQGFWLDIENPDDADFALLEKTFKFHQLTLEDIRHQNQRPKVEEYPGYAFVVLFTAELEGSRVQIREHHIYLSGQYLVSVHLEPSDILDRLRDRIKANPDLAHRSLPYLFYLVVDQLVDSLFPVLEKLDDATHAVEDSIIERPDTAPLIRLITLLAVFASLFLPLSFLTGFFGMNFAWLVSRIMPAWTFWVLAVGVMAVTTLGQLLYYRRHGWI